MRGWNTTPHGMGKVATVAEAPGWQRVAAAVLLQAKVDANSSNPRRRAEARQWIREDSDLWLAVICPPDQDVRQLHREYVELIEEAA